ncbi:alpha/beta hydrolase [Mycolicibacterium sp. 018/SC-01/001]|uniref:alpha/beta fold hydrolase n=1 Tax=Mycolicibacterium sp. 018/SC-01/001 TaxID=2592069 RepID=UPI00117C33F1|nr:alpha/beta hydrolase [Mycolicibacterium sp. 018/SC-01/001]TRW79802.1 alpha/beta hydrolase [Mycolicibacterium sp. 018/SC-01/001]
MSTHQLTVPGARLHYEVRGSGPLLVLVGSPMGAADFQPLADAMAPERTVVTLDPRGYGASTIDDPDQPATVETRAQDVVAILDDMGAGRADVFGSSGGAVTGLALVTGWPARVGTLVAHEPPLIALLPDAEIRRADTERIIETFHAEGVHAAWRAFMINAGFELPEGDGETPPPSDEERRHAARFFDHDLRATTGYRPDVAALRASRVVVGIGADSGALLTYPTSSALADALGVRAQTFPGGHVGFLTDTAAFAEALQSSLGAQA